MNAPRWCPEAGMFVDDIVRSPEWRAEVVTATVSRHGITAEEAEARIDSGCGYPCEEHGVNWKECPCFM